MKKKRKRILIDSIPKKIESLVMIKDKSSNMVIEPYGYSIKGEFIHKDRANCILRSNENGIDYVSYYIRVNKRKKKEKC